MASLWKHPQSRYWTACFTDRAGKQRKRSTGTTNRKEAMKLAEQYEEAARRLRTARQAREVIASLHREITHEELLTLTVRNFFESWLNRKKPETAPATLVFYANAASKFLKFVEGAADGDLTEITREHVTKFRNHEAKTLASKTVNHDLKCLKMIFKAAKRDGVLSEDPTEFVDTVRKTETSEQRRPFTIPEIQAVLSVADEEWRSLIRFGFYTGQRLSDLCSLTWANLDLARNEIRLATRKTGRRMILPISASLQKHIQSLPPHRPEDPIHPKAFAILAREKKSGSLSNQFADLLAKAGLREKKNHKRAAIGEGRNGRRASNALSFHCLRRTATTLLHESGIPSAVAQELIGHDSEEMHRHYVNVGSKSLRDAAETLPDL